MLVTFKSKAAAEVIMYEEHAKRLLDMLGKEVEKGIIRAEEAPEAIARIEREIEELKQQAMADKVQQEEDLDGEQEREAIQTVSFSARAYPLLEMLRAAQVAGQPVIWGV